MSPEVLEHHWRRHDGGCPCLLPPNEDRCGCGTSVLLRCGCCGAVLFLVLPEDLAPCAHADRVLARGGHAVGGWQ